MPKRSAFDRERLRQVLQAQHQVITRRQALLCGMPHSTVDRYIAADGPWQRLLPGVYLAVTGTVTQDQRDMAALLYAGQPSLITGSAAVRRHRLSPPGPDVVDVLIPWNRHRQSTGFVRMHRTRRMPERGYVTGKIWFAKPPRAVADAARSLTRFDDVRHVVCAAVQQRVCTVAELTEELQAGRSSGATLFRDALAEVGDGVRSVAEGDCRILILRSDLPKPMFNARLFDADGVFIAMVDAWWGAAGDEINWRRFFDINGLAGLRIEDPRVFEATHATLFRLYADGLIDGFRVDHVDGLSDPPGYCRRLRQRLDALAPGRHAYLVIEKILGAGETLPTDWGIDGTSGYDFMNEVSAVQHATSATATLEQLWRELSGRPAHFEAEEVAARQEILQHGFDAQLQAVTAALHRLARAEPATRDMSAAKIRAGLIALLAHFPVYRGYDAGSKRSPIDSRSRTRARSSARSSGGRG